MTNEKRFSKNLRSTFQRIRLRSFEACGLPDTPDLLGIIPRLGTRGSPVFWIELKCVKSVMRQIPFRRGQPKWIDDYEKDGGKVVVLVLQMDQNLIWILRPKGHVRQMVGCKLVDLDPSLVVTILPHTSPTAIESRVIDSISRG